MSDQHFLSSDAASDVFGPLYGGERMMWRGRCGVAEYAFEEAASLPRWTLPESTDVLVTDHRVLYAYTADDGHEIKSGELRWLWPQHLRVQPGARSRDRGAAATQIQLVCGGADGTYPALVFAGGDLATVEDADRVANVIRQAIARFRVDNADRIGLTVGQSRMLSRLLIGPEFRNHQGGEGQTVSLLGALLVNRPAAPPPPDRAPPPDPAPSSFAAAPPDPIPPHVTAPPPDPIPRHVTAPPPAPVPPPAVAPEDSLPLQLPGESGTRLIHRPGMAGDAARAMMAARAEEATHTTEPATASRAADLAARVANLVSQFAELGEQPTSPADQAAGIPEQYRWLDVPPADQAAGSPEQYRWLDVPPADEPDGTGRPAYSGPWHAEPQTADADRFEMRTTNLAARAEAARRTAARMAANSAGFRAGSRRADREQGISPKGNRNT